MGAVRRSEGVVDVDVAVFGELSGEELVAGLFFSVEAKVSSRATSPGTRPWVTSRALSPTQSSANFTGLPNKLDRVGTTCFSDNSALGPLGRPRWLINTTEAPPSSRAWMVGMARRMRVSSVTVWASSRGTLKSTRTNARLPSRLREERVMGSNGASQQLKLGTGRPCSPGRRRRRSSRRWRCAPASWCRGCARSRRGPRACRGPR